MVLVPGQDSPQVGSSRPQRSISALQTAPAPPRLPSASRQALGVRALPCGCPAQPLPGSHCRKLSSLAWLLPEEDAEGAADAGLETFFFLLLTANGRISVRFV